MTFLAALTTEANLHGFLTYDICTFDVLYQHLAADERNAAVIRPKQDAYARVAIFRDASGDTYAVAEVPLDDPNDAETGLPLDEAIHIAITW